LESAPQQARVQQRAGAAGVAAPAAATGVPHSAAVSNRPVTGMPMNVTSQGQTQTNAPVQRVARPSAPQPVEKSKRNLEELTALFGASRSGPQRTASPPSTTSNANAQGQQPTSNHPAVRQAALGHAQAATQPYSRPAVGATAANPQQQQPRSTVRQNEEELRNLLGSAVAPATGAAPGSQPPRATAAERIPPSATAPAGAAPGAAAGAGARPNMTQEQIHVGMFCQFAVVVVQRDLREMGPERMDRERMVRTERDFRQAIRYQYREWNESRITQRQLFERIFGYVRRINPAHTLQTFREQFRAFMSSNSEKRRARLQQEQAQQQANQGAPQTIPIKDQTAPSARPQSQQPSAASAQPRALQQPSGGASPAKTEAVASPAKTEAVSVTGVGQTARVAADSVKNELSAAPQGAAATNAVGNAVTTKKGEKGAGVANGSLGDVAGVSAGDGDSAAVDGVGVSGKTGVKRSLENAVGGNAAKKNRPDSRAKANRPKSGKNAQAKAGKQGEVKGASAGETKTGTGEEAPAASKAEANGAAAAGAPGAPAVASETAGGTPSKGGKPPPAKPGTAGPSPAGAAGAKKADVRKAEEKKRQADDEVDIVKSAGIDVDNEEDALVDDDEGDTGMIDIDSDASGKWLLSAPILVSRMESVAKSHGLIGVRGSCAEYVSLAVRCRVSNVIERLTKISRARSETAKALWGFNSIAFSGRDTRRRLEELRREEARQLDKAAEARKQRRLDAMSNRTGEGGGGAGASGGDSGLAGKEELTKKAETKAVTEKKRQEESMMQTNKTLSSILAGNLRRRKNRQKGGAVGGAGLAPTAGTTPAAKPPLPTAVKPDAPASQVPVAVVPPAVAVSSNAVPIAAPAPPATSAVPSGAAATTSGGSPLASGTSGTKAETLATVPPPAVGPSASGAAPGVAGASVAKVAASAPTQVPAQPSPAPSATGSAPVASVPAMTAPSAASAPTAVAPPVGSGAQRLAPGGVAAPAQPSGVSTDDIPLRPSSRAPAGDQKQVAGTGGRSALSIAAASIPRQPIGLRDCLFLMEHERQMRKSWLLYKWRARVIASAPAAAPGVRKSVP